MNKEFSKLCTPAKIYFGIAVIASVFALINGVKIIAVFLKLLFAFIWTFILAWLCDKGYKSLSWFLVLLPYVVIILATSGIYYLSSENKKLMNSLQFQGPYGQSYTHEGMTMPMKGMKKTK
jgi:energy-coupling factor transporter transmembrane protein EcfT